MPTARPAGGPLADGTWTGIRWYSDGKPALDPSPSIDMVKPTPGLQVSTSFSMFGWSKGYVGFRETQFWNDDSMDPPRYSIVAESSTDGLSWTAAGLLGSLGDVASIGRVVEGPGGLLALGYGGAATCGPPASIEGLWASSDGRAWSPLKMPFGKDSIYTVDAGGAGYIAMGVHSTGTPALWTSADGRTWTSSTPPVSAKTGTVQDATAFSRGFVVVGAVRGDEGCGGPGALTPAVWWSANGASWTRASLPGAPTASDAWMTVSRISDNELFAMASTSDAATQTSVDTFWTSADGRSWSLVKTPASVTSFVTNGSRGMAGSCDEKYAWHFWAFEPDGSIQELTSTGVVLPSGEIFDGRQLALGPAGLVMTDYEGSRFYLGVPTS